MLQKFSVKLVHSTMCGKNFQNYVVHISSKCIEFRHFYPCPLGAHLGFLEDRRPNFEMVADVQATRYKLQILYISKKNPEHIPMYLLILSLTQKLNTSEYKPMLPCSERSLLIG